VHSVKEAVTRLGVAGTLAAAMNTVMSTSMQQGLSGYAMAAGAIWQHSCASSIAADVIRSECSVPPPSSLGATALLHDVGKLVLDATLGPHHRFRTHPLLVRGPELCAAERDALGVDHGMVGAFVAETWQLPPAISEGIRLHHGPPTDALPAAIGLADAVAHAVVDDGHELSDGGGWDAELARQVLGIPRDRLDSIVAITAGRLAGLVGRFATTS
jgi:HD-like signal output (HDOD) protein